ncbi:MULTISPECIES: helix-turn-helix domain-containing protein [Bacillaceae]|uniref:HTH cro/C1-type domain-containing protein n=1 Tax=Alkalicoccobacillus plakortidis TaxID=444060 RepID=A0A9D5DQ92_9BACI|nr:MULTISPECIES: helix-turn-helix transcriptional regulator [Bacillaceae]KQL58323.1 hypothetical protein AN965_04500 [Alkalicoccobacillus plakortidis]
MIRIKLKQLLKEREMTMYELSKRTGIRPNTISQWVNDKELSKEGKGVKSITRETLDTLCMELQCEVEDLVEYVEE